MFGIKLLVWILSFSYLITAIVFSLIQSDDVGPQNYLAYITIAYLSYLTANILVVGLLLLRRIKSISGLMYATNRYQIKSHIIITSIFMLSRFVLDLVQSYALKRVALQNCRKINYYWQVIDRHLFEIFQHRSYFIFLQEFSQIIPLFGFIIYLLMTYMNQQLPIDQRDSFLFVSRITDSIIPKKQNQTQTYNHFSSRTNFQQNGFYNNIQEQSQRPDSSELVEDLSMYNRIESDAVPVFAIG